MSKYLLEWLVVLVLIWSSVCNEVYSHSVLFPLFISIMKSLRAQWLRPLASPKTKPSQRPDASWQSVAIESFLWPCVQWILSGGAAVCTCRSVCACVYLCVGVCTRYLRVESTWLCVSAPPGALRQLFVCLRWAARSEIHTYANVWSGSRRPRAPRAAENVKIIPFLSTSLFTPQNHAEALCWQ